MQVKEVSGRIFKQYGEQEAVSPAADILVYASQFPEEQFSTRTDKNGYFLVIVPETETKISVVSPDLQSGGQREDYTIQTNPNWNITLKLKYYGKLKTNYTPIVIFILAIGFFIYLKRRS
jgi:hypothetical protein